MDKAQHKKRLPAAIEAMRPHQWHKNAFVFAAPVFAREITQPDKLLATVVAFVAFSFASSAVYLMNDLRDLEGDRLHPKKKSRPLPSGRLSKGQAVQLIALLVALSAGLCIFLLPLATTLVIAVYVAANVLYSFGLKQVVILDVMFIAVGFILRILAGAAATAVNPSYWLILCTLNVSLFLGFTKRRAEIIELETDAHSHRAVLAHYSQAFLDQMIAIVTGATLVCYILYTVDERTVAVFGTYGLVATVPFVMYGLFRYLYLGYHLHEGGNPSELVVKDVPLVINGILWILACIIVIYWGPMISDLMPWSADLTPKP